MFPKNFVVSPETGQKMQSLGFEKSFFVWAKDRYSDLGLTNYDICQDVNAIIAPTLGEITLSENGWKIFNAMRAFSELSEIELRAYCWITERILTKKEVENE